MASSNDDKADKAYIIGVSLLTFVFPAVAYLIQLQVNREPFSLMAAGSWFIFFASGWRLLLAGLRQIAKPAFTAKTIFHMEGETAYPVIRELGFANFCTGLVALISLFCPSWRIVSAFGSGLYFGLAGLMHLLKRPAGINEKFALYTDLVIFLFLSCLFIGLL